MSSEIKPCPFCSSTNIKVTLEWSNWFVACLECEANGPGFDDDDTGRELALKSWNKLSSLRSDLEAHWLIVHDEHCTNMRDCSSFGSTKECEAPRPDSLLS